MTCAICGGGGVVVCPTRQGGTIAFCLSCARELGRLWAERRGG